MKDDETRTTQSMRRPRELTPVPQAPVDVTMIPPLRFTYTNYRGETAERQVIPREVFFGSTPAHPEQQWFLRAYDLDRRAERSFAIRDIVSFRGPA